MKRAALASILFFGAVFAAHADNDTYNDITGRNRGDDLLHVDTTYCDWRLGSPPNGTVTSVAYKRCMRTRGWAFEQTQVEPGRMVCRATVLTYEEMPYALNNHYVAQMTLRVTPPRGRAFETTITRSVSRHQPPHRGSTLSVLCDPDNPQDVHPAD